MEQKKDHILVCLSSSPSNARIIRTAARMAEAFHGTFTALYVETSSDVRMDAVNKKRLQKNIALAQQLGAVIETVYGDDVPFMIAEFVRLSGVTKVVIGRSPGAGRKRHILKKLTLSEQLLLHMPNMEIHIIPDQQFQLEATRRDLLNFRLSFSIVDMLKSIGILLAASVIGLIFAQLGFADANIIMTYVLAVLIISVVTSNQLYSFFASIASVLVFNFLFTIPRFSLKAYDKDYPLTFVIMFISAMLTGSLATRMKSSAENSAKNALRMRILLDTNQYLQKAQSNEDIYRVTVDEIRQLVHRSIVLYTVVNGELGEPQIFNGEQDADETAFFSEADKSAVLWTLHSIKHASSSTSPYIKARCIYFAIKSQDAVLGIVGIPVNGQPWDNYENTIILSILSECALALENRKNAYEKEQAAIMAKNEQLRANLLRTISHDLRTPLTSISGNSSILLKNDDSLDGETKKKLYQDIYDDSIWLINIVENLLSITRLEEGRLHFHMTAELVEDVIRESLRHANRLQADHVISIACEDDLLMARMDARLIIQVLVNLVDNAIKYTEAGSRISISAGRNGNMAEISVADDGPGIGDEYKEHIFDIFYTGAHKFDDSRRSLGLGLYLCRSIILAHGGMIEVRDNVPRGCRFTFTLPIEEVHLNGEDNSIDCGG